MSNLTQNFANPNTQPLVIGEFSIRQDEDGRYCLNDLHKASGGLAKHKPSNFIRNQQTQELIVEIEQVSDVSSANFDRCSNMSIGQKAINTIKGGVKQGMYVVEDLVYSYAMWISAKFHLMVIRAYRAQVMEWMIGGKQTISPEQAGILYNIVHTRAGENKNLIVQMWSRLKNHFKYSASYRELRAIHFEDAKHYLEVMDLKGKKEASYFGFDDTSNQQYRPWQDENVQFLMWYVPKLAKIIKNDIYPALSMLRSEYSAQLIGYAQEAACHANLLNRAARKNGLTHYDQLGGQPIHTIEWYLAK
ncbi:KilA-N domain-containing protein [Acinetobacter sp. YH12126]|uniref:KilA-N domain-containing protein n=1 Tax=Acinetobacter sp. YH12126 TaxID=2601111 RepID=UPI00211E7823|nr:KilA-N domain-containing protein [Acinetobacter sp. YH12126]